MSVWAHSPTPSRCALDGRGRQHDDERVATGVADRVDEAEVDCLVGAVDDLGVGQSTGVRDPSLSQSADDRLAERDGDASTSTFLGLVGLHGGCGRCVAVHGERVAARVADEVGVVDRDRLVRVVDLAPRGAGSVPALAEERADDRLAERQGDEGTSTFLGLVDLGEGRRAGRGRVDVEVDTDGVARCIFELGRLGLAAVVDLVPGRLVGIAVPALLGQRDRFVERDVRLGTSAFLGLVGLVGFDDGGCRRVCGCRARGHR